MIPVSKSRRTEKKKRKNQKKLISRQLPFLPSFSPVSIASQFPLILTKVDVGRAGLREGPEGPGPWASAFQNKNLYTYSERGEAKHLYEWKEMENSNLLWYLLQYIIFFCNCLSPYTTQQNKTF